MNTHLARFGRRLVQPAFALMLCGSVAAAEPRTVNLRDWTGRGFTPDLVNYTIDAPTDGGKSLRLLDADGQPLPVQVTPGEKGKATVEIGTGKARLVVPERAYAQLSVGNVGVRGVGPFDLTFTADAITGKVDGDVRTLVTTWPEKIVRPGYVMDGVRWYAGFADEHSIYKGTKTPQFGIAFGVSAGPHTVKINEWEWPAVPPAPDRASVALK